jgi:hypothetical protein
VKRISNQPTEDVNRTFGQLNRRGVGKERIVKSGARQFNGQKDGDPDSHCDLLNRHKRVLVEAPDRSRAEEVLRGWIQNAVSARTSLARRYPSVPRTSRPERWGQALRLA